MARYRLSWNIALVIGFAITFAAVFWFSGAGVPPKQALFIVCPGVAFTAMLLLGSDSVLERMQKWIAERRLRIAAVPAGLWLLYVIYAVGMRIESPAAIAA